VRRGRHRGIHRGPPRPRPSQRPSAPRATGRSGQGLASTGFDLTPMALLGLALLVSGIGLRLRTVDADIF
jgi:hypothetical protein